MNEWLMKHILHRNSESHFFLFLLLLLYLTNFIFIFYLNIIKPLAVESVLFKFVI